MTPTQRNTRRWLGALLVAVIGLPPGDARAIVSQAPVRRADDEAREVAFLVQQGTAGSLAAASLLTHLIDAPPDSHQQPDAAALMQRAAALAPQRPEILWLLLRDCEMRQCAEKESIVARLRAADPDNGLALLPELRASQGGAPAETTRIIAAIGDAKTFTLYWNKSLVMLFDAMTHGPTARPATALTHDADDRLTHAAGVLAAIDVPPFKPIRSACGEDQFQETGRRAACEKLMARLDAADCIIAQSLSVSVQLKWWPPGSPAAQGLQARRLQQEYLVQAAGRVRGEHVNEDAVTRVAAMRSTATEAEADAAVLAAFHEPAVRPADWHLPGAGS